MPRVYACKLPHLRFGVSLYLCFETWFGRKDRKEGREKNSGDRIEKTDTTNQIGFLLLRSTTRSASDFDLLRNQPIDFHLLRRFNEVLDFMLDMLLFLVFSSLDSSDEGSDEPKLLVMYISVSSRAS